MEDILPLVRTAKLPSPVLKPAVPREDSASAESVVQQQDAAPGSPRLAPYQALPVTKSTIITHNITPALPVLEPGELDKEVGCQARVISAPALCAFLLRLALLPGVGRGLALRPAGAGSAGELPASGSGVASRRPPSQPAVPPRCLQELEARINKVIDDYKEKLQLRTDHHMG